MGILDVPAQIIRQSSYVRNRDSLCSGLPIVASRANGFSVNSGNLSNGTDTQSTYRSMHVVRTDATEIRLLFGNHYNGGTDGLNTISVQCGVEAPTVVGTGNGGQVGAILKVSARGSRTISIDPGCFVLSDPLPIRLTAGQTLYVHTNVSVGSAGQKWPLDLYSLGSNWEGKTAGSNLAYTSGIAQTTEPMYTPIAIVGQPVSSTAHPVVVALAGDSITYGSGDSQNSLGWAVRALNSAGIAYMQLCKPGEKATDVTTTTAYSVREMLAAGCTHAVEAYGRNDWANGRTLAQVQADRLTIATRLAQRGLKVWAATNMPGTTSTDSWATTGNQTVTSGESVRVALNDWIRDGCPTSAGVAVATGTVGALRAGSTGHPYSGYFEVADTVETARNSGFWKVTGAANAYTTDGTHPSGTGHTTAAAALDATKLV